MQCNHWPHIFAHEQIPACQRHVVSRNDLSFYLWSCYCLGQLNICISFILKNLLVLLPIYASFKNCLKYMLRTNFRTKIPQKPKTQSLSLSLHSNWYGPSTPSLSFWIKQRREQYFKFQKAFKPNRLREFRVPHVGVRFCSITNRCVTRSSEEWKPRNRFNRGWYPVHFRMKMC